MTGVDVIFDVWANVWDFVGVDAGGVAVEIFGGEDVGDVAELAGNVVGVNWVVSEEVGVGVDFIKFSSKIFE